MPKCRDCGADYIPTGRVVRCLPCRRVWDRAWRARREAAGRPVPSGKASLEKERAWRAVYYKKESVRRKRAERAAARGRDPRQIPRIAARVAVRNAIRRGELVKGQCFCGATRVQAHHHDYSKPLDVVWLCHQHHVELHVKEKANERH